MDPKKKKLVITLLGGLVLYLASTGLSFAAFRFLGGFEGSLTSPVPVEEARSRVDLSAPKTESCLLNGKMFTKGEKEIWEDRRPVAVMVENHLDSRPQSGLSRADVVYEAVAEGGITRFLAIYYCGAAAQEVRIAPVRSVRVYYLDWASEYGKNPIFLHVGGANNFCPTCPGGVKPAGTTAKDVRAIEFLEKIGWRKREGNDFDAAFDIGYPILWRDYERLGRPVATEHTMMASLDEVYKEAEKRDLGAKDESGKVWSKNFVAWKFAENGHGQGNSAGNIKIEFWSGQPEYQVEWKYDPDTQEYLRFNGGVPHNDHEEGIQLRAKNVVVMYLKEEGPVDQEKHINYTTIGKGEAVFFQNGQAIKGAWEKESRESRTKFYDQNGQEQSLAKGSVWIEIVPTHQEINY